MLNKLFAPTVLALALATPAFAAGTGSSGTTGTSSTTSEQNQGGNQASTPVIAQKLHNSLTQAGFTDVHVMPQSFLVRAKDKDGNPVMMIINPDSMTAITAMGTSGNSTNGSQASGSSGSTTSQKQ